MTAKAYIKTGASGGTVGDTVFTPGTGKVIRVTGILVTGGTAAGTFNLILNNGTADYTIMKNIPIDPSNSGDFTVTSPINILYGWTLKATMSEGVTVNISGEEF